MPTPPTDWGVPVHTITGPEGRLAYLAGAGGAPRVQVWVGEQMTMDFFAFESSQRGGVNGDWGDDGLLYVMPGGEGGPRLRVFYATSPSPSNPVPHRDEFVADPNQRASWVPCCVTVNVPGPPVPVPGPPVPVPGPPVPVPGPPVPVPGPPVPVPVPVPVFPEDFTHGDPSAPTTHTIYVSFEPSADQPTLDVMNQAVRLFAEQVAAGLGPNVAVTTRRPDMYPAAYLALNHVTTLDFTRDQFPPAGVAAVAPARILVPYDNRWYTMDCWFDAANTADTAEGIAAAMMHETWHCYGWPYDHPGGSWPTPEWEQKCRDNVQVAVEIAAKYRFPPPAPPPARGHFPEECGRLVEELREKLAR